MANENGGTTESEQVFPGQYMPVDGLHLFKLEAPELERLAHLLLGAAARGAAAEPLRLRIGTGNLLFTPATEARFTAQQDENGLLTVIFDADSLHEVAELILQMTHDHNADHFAHTHFEAFFTSPPEGGLTDIVIERIAPPVA